MKSDETVPESGCRMQQLQSHKMEDDFSAAFQSHLVGDGLLVSFASSLSKGFLVRNDFGSMSRFSDTGLLASFPVPIQI